MRAVALVVAATATLAAQAPAFEVASIRVNRDLSDRPTLLRPILEQSGRVLMRNQSLHDLIIAAYRMRENDVLGGPEWIRSTGFDLEARGPAGMSAETARAMLQTLLSQRFSLAVHTERRELPIYELTRASVSGRNGPQLKFSGTECAAMTRPAGMPPLAPPPKNLLAAVSLMAAGPAPRCPSLSLPGHLSRRATSMNQLANVLADITGRPVINRTGLAGEFDFDLTYRPALDALPPGADATLPDLTTVLREQLDLRLEAGRGPVEVMIIDGARMPTEN